MAESTGAQTPLSVDVTSSADDYSNRAHHSSKFVVLADLNDPPETDEDDSNSVATAASTILLPSEPPSLTVEENSQDKIALGSRDHHDGADGELKKLHKLGKCRSRLVKLEDHLDCGADVDADQHSQGTSSSREEKVSSLKTVSVLLFL